MMLSFLFLKRSEEAELSFNNKSNLIFIEGDHSFEAVSLDYHIGNYIIKENGIMEFHDTLNDSGLSKIVLNYLLKSKNFIKMNFAYSIICGHKTLNNNIFDRANNDINLFTKKVYEYGMKAKTPQIIKSAGKIISKAFNKS